MCGGGKCNPDPQVAASFHRLEEQRLADIERWGQCEEISYRNKRCHYPIGHDRGHHAGDGITWATDVEHEGGQAAELKKLFETCKTIIPGIELPAWVEFQADLSHLGFLLGIKNEDA
jgi:hypothetical protein